MSSQLSLQKNVLLFIPVAVPEVGGHGGREEGSWTRGSLLRLEGLRAARPGAQGGEREEGLPCSPTSHQGRRRARDWPLALSGHTGSFPLGIRLLTWFLSLFLSYMKPFFFSPDQRGK